MNAYGALLKKLIRFTNIKLTNLAEIVGYDTSYISKWCNKDKLPAAKASSNVNKCLAGVFAHEIYLQDDVALFSSEFDVIAPDSESNLADMILRLLKDAYKSAYNNTLDSSKSTSVSQYRILLNPVDLHNFFNSELIEIITSLNHPCTIYSTMDICYFLEGFDFEKPADINFPCEINIKCGFNPANIGKNRQYISKIYTLLNYYNDIDFDFYDNSCINEMNLIIIKDVLAVQCSIDKTHNISMATVVTDTREVNNILQKVIGEFSKKKLLIHSTDSNDLFYSGYRTEFYSHNQFQLFITRGFEFLLPPEIMPKLIQASIDQGFDSTMQQLIANLGITWEEIFEKGTIDFYLLKTSLLQYIQNGIIFFADVPYKMSTAERKAHIESVLRLTQLNPNIRFHIIDDEMLSNRKNLMNISVYNNHKKMFLKNSLRYNTSKSPKFYTVLNDAMIQDISAYMEEIISSSCINTYDSGKIKAFYDTFGNMINRMLSIQD